MKTKGWREIYNLKESLHNGENGIEWCDIYIYIYIFFIIQDQFEIDYSNPLVDESKKQRLWHKHICKIIVIIIVYVSDMENSASFVPDCTFIWKARKCLSKNGSSKMCNVSLKKRSLLFAKKIDQHLSSFPAVNSHPHIPGLCSRVRLWRHFLHF